jgi:predicted Zn-dependent peptidase
VLVGVKGLDQVPATGQELMKYKITAELLLQLLFGNTSQNYLKLYNQGLLDDSFSYEFNLDRSFHFADIGGDSDQPERLAAEIEAILLAAADSPEITTENVALLKKKMIGKYFQALNSLEYIANQFSQSLYGETTLFDKIAVIESIQLADIQKMAQEFIQEAGFSQFYMYPKADA